MSLHFRILWRKVAAFEWTWEEDDQDWVGLHKANPRREVWARDYFAHYDLQEVSDMILLFTRLSLEEECLS